jgi:predicted AAA+ superfamily ATPase
MRIQNVDVYVTGSNAKFLSKDIITEFRGRGDEMHMNPLSFSEFMSVYEGNKYDGWKEYILYGGLPSVAQLNSSEQKMEYLKNIFDETYINDIVGRHKVKNRAELEELLNILSSGIGSLTNPKKLSDTFKSVKQVTISPKTINNYLEYLCDSFLISAAHRYDIRGRKYIGTPMKYYYSDTGLRNARINFRQLEETHTMENVIYNELIIRDYNVDVGAVMIQQRDKQGKMIRKNLEVDFVCNKGSKRYYIQSAYSMPTEEKMIQEQRSLVRIDDSFKKIIITKDTPTPTYNEAGVLIMSVFDFILNKDSLESM